MPLLRLTSTFQLDDGPESEPVVVRVTFDAAEYLSYSYSPAYYVDIAERLQALILEPAYYAIGQKIAKGIAESLKDAST